jgi:hypothetical protein
VNLTSYADLAVLLVNAPPGRDGTPDSLGNSAALRGLIADRPYLAGPITHADLTALTALRTELAAIFTAAAAGDEQVAVARLNALLVRHPVHPVVTGGDGPGWQLDLAGHGTVADRFAVAAAAGLASVVTSAGLNRLGQCAARGCGGVFVDSSASGSRRHCAGHGEEGGTVTALRSRDVISASEHPSTAAS